MQCCYSCEGQKVGGKVQLKPCLPQPDNGFDICRGFLGNNTYHREPHKLGKVFCCRLRNHWTKGLREHGFFMFEGSSAQPHLPPQAHHLLLWTSSEMMLFMVPPRWAQEKKTTISCKLEINPHSDFAKPKGVCGYLSKMLWILWLVFKRWEWLTVSRKVFFKTTQLDVCLGVSQFKNTLDTWSSWILTVIMYFFHSRDE